MKLQDVPVLILCGGLGTRLHSVLPELPKVLAPVGDKLFLDYILSYLKKQGVSRVILALGHKAECVEDYLKNRTLGGITLTTIIEPRPLGTGGAVRYAMEQLSEIPEQLIVMNGDTFIDAPFDVFLTESVNAGANIGMVSAFVDDCGRYGELTLSAFNQVIKFNEKSTDNVKAGWINGGVYLFDSETLTKLANDNCTSLEKEFFPRMLKEGLVWAFQHDGVFLDIGTPESFDEANNNYKKFEGLMF